MLRPISKFFKDNLIGSSPRGVKGDFPGSIQRADCCFAAEISSFADFFIVSEHDEITLVGFEFKWNLCTPLNNGVFRQRSRISSYGIPQLWTSAGDTEKAITAYVFF